MRQGWAAVGVFIDTGLTELKLSSYPLHSGKHSLGFLSLGDPLSWEESILIHHDL